MGTQNFQKATKAKIVNTLPALKNAELGEVYYDVANTRLALRLVTGWVYFTQD